MAGGDRPEIYLELSNGTLRIQAAEATYVITAYGEGAAPPPPRPIAAPAPAPAPAPAVGATAAQLADIDLGPVEALDSYYRQISEEMYQEMGRLARKLSVSIQDLPRDGNIADLAESGQRLESAKDQLADVIAMTEKATMNIMDLTDEIQDDVSEARSAFTALSKLEVMDEDQRNAFLEQLGALINAFKGIRPVIEQAVAKQGQAIALIDGLSGVAPAPESVAEPVAEPAPEPEPVPAAEPTPAEPQTVIEKKTIFPLNDLFQIMYELCANDDVKKHIKVVWNKMDEFDDGLVNDQLNAQQDGFEHDEGFIMVPIEPLLKSLFAATENTKFKDLIKRLNANRSTLFLDQSLPVEVQMEEVEVEVAPEPVAEPAPEPTPAPAPEPTPEPAVEPAPPGDLDADGLGQVRAKLTEIKADLEAFSQEALTGEVDESALEVINNSAFIQSDKSQTVTEIFGNSVKAIQRIGDSVNTIVEQLSFQDLAGQRIHKIVSLISQFQVELLKLLVSFKPMVKAERDQVPVSQEEAQAKKDVGQKEVDDMLDKLGLGDVDDEADLTAGPGGASRLSQNTVDDMLAELGF